MTGLIEFFHKLKIRYKILLILGVSTLILAVGTVFVSWSMIRRFNQTLYESVATTLQLASRIVERELNDARNLILDTATDGTFQSALDSIEAARSDYEREKEYQRIKTVLRRNARRDKSVPFTAYIGPNEGDRLLTSASIPVVLPEFVIGEIENYSLKEYSSVLILPPNSGENFWVIINVRRISDYSLTPRGVLAATVDMNAITDLYTREPGTSDAVLAIYSRGVKIFETRPSPVFDTTVLEGDSDRGYWISNSKESPYLAAFFRSEKMDLDYVYFSSTLAIRKETRTKALVLLGNLIFLAIFSIGGTYLLAGYITRPLENLRDQLEEMVKGEFSPSILVRNNYSGDDEIKTFDQDFQIMASRIHNLVKENYQKTIETQEARLAALEMQINPHFLYNTLDSIYWLSLSGKTGDVSTMIGSLSKLLRRTLEQDQNLVSLGKEIEYLDDYIAIQKIRFGDRLRWKNTVRDSFYDMPVPPLILQTLAENSIVHGLEPRKEGCSIVLSADCKGSLLEIRMEDDGLGLSGKNPYEEGIGLTNIRNRLRIIYGGDASLDICGIKPHGMRAMVKLPFTREGT